MRKDYENYSDETKEHGEEEFELQSLLINELKGNNNSTKPATKRNDNRRPHHSAIQHPNCETNKEHKKSKTPWGCIITVILLLLLIAGGFVGYYYYAQNEKAKKEELMYAVLMQENYNLRDYEDFVREFPNSKYRQDVEKRLEELQDMYDEWNLIKNTPNVNALKNFCNKYNSPNCELYFLALEEIDKLDWKFAKERNTIDAYTTYINEHPEGKWVIQAESERDSLQKKEERQRLLELEKQKELESQKSDSINSTTDTVTRDKSNIGSRLNEVKELIDKWF